MSGRIPRREDEPDRIVGGRVVDVDRPGLRLERHDVVRIEESRDDGHSALDSLDDPRLLARRRVVDGDPHEEPIALRLGKRVDPLGLDRVLGGHDEERPRSRQRPAADRHLAFLHDLEECRLDFRRCPVDLVGKDDVEIGLVPSGTSRVGRNPRADVGGIR
jgi:hypothetical protein